MAGKLFTLTLEEGRSLLGGELCKGVKFGLAFVFALVMNLSVKLLSLGFRLIQLYEFV